MKHARRWKLCSAQRADMWNRWKAGQSLQEIGRTLGKGSIFEILYRRYVPDAWDTNTRLE